MKKSAQFLLLAAWAASLVVFDRHIAEATSVGVAVTQASGTLTSLDNSAGQYPVITYIASQPGSGDGYTYTNWAVFANDGTGSLELFGTMPGGYTPALGDAVSASGTFSPFHNIPELGTLTAIAQQSTGNSVPGR